MGAAAVVHLSMGMVSVNSFFLIPNFSYSTVFIIIYVFMYRHNLCFCIVINIFFFLIEEIIQYLAFKHLLED